MNKGFAFLWLLGCSLWYPFVGGAQSLTAPVRGTWITNVASEALYSREAVRATVQRCKEQGINHLFVVVWNGGHTLYPSAVVESHTGVCQHPRCKGFDPLQAMVEEGHAQGLKVHAWFEYGLAYAYADSNSRWYQRYPHWAGRNRQGNLLQKNGFFWWNGLHPEVQQLMEALMLEVVRNYDVDGVQGDDRLPAMPSEGGYDSLTLALYCRQTGQEAPADPRAPAWLQWKADQLSALGQRLYRAVKQERPSCLVSWAPSIYPWSLQQYLQDWPAWLRGGYADFVLPQLYRYDAASYERLLQQLDSLLLPGEKQRVFPGVLSSLGNGYLVQPDLLQEMIRLNRKYGFEGECFFFFESLRKLPQVYPSRRHARGTRLNPKKKSHK